MDHVPLSREQNPLKPYSDTATQVVLLIGVIKELVLLLVASLQGVVPLESLYTRLQSSRLRRCDTPNLDGTRSSSPDSATESQENASTLEACERPSESAVQQLCKALVRRDHETVSRMLEVAPLLVNRQHKGGWFPLHTAVLTGDVELVKLILKNPSTDVSVVHEPSSAFHLDREGELGMDVVDTYGATPLHYACMIGNADIIDVLMCHGALPDSRDKKKQEPLEYFNLERDLGVATKFRHLYKEWQDRCQFYNEYPTVDDLARMVQQNQFDSFAQVLSEHPEVASKLIGSDFTLLHLAAIRQRSSFVELLLSTCPDLINKVSNRSSYSCDDPRAYSRRYILPPFYPDDCGIGDRCGHSSENSLSSFAPPVFPHKYVKDATALHYACLTGDLDIITLLIKAGADWNIKDSKGRKPEELLYPKTTDYEHVKRVFSELCAAEEEKKKSTNGENPQRENGDVCEDADRLDPERSSESGESDEYLSRKIPIESFLSLDERMEEKLVGQRGPIRVVSHAVRLREAGWVDPDRPLTMLFLGSSGVGKTELAKQLALFLHGENGLATNKGKRIDKLEKEQAFVRIDMSEFQQRHTIYNLIGAPKSYVGYGDGGALTQPLKKNPRAIVLLDEIEKAHPDVLTLFLQVFDDGRITDSEDGVIYCKDAIFIMTSNIASDKIKEKSPELRDLVAQAEAEERPELYLSAVRAFTRSIRPDLKEALKRDEFIGRINEIVVFLPLSKEEITTVVERELGIWAKRAEEKHKITLSWTDDVVQKLASAYDVNYGVRSVANQVQRVAIHLVADAQMTGQIPDDCNAVLSTNESGDIKLDTVPKEPKE